MIAETRDSISLRGAGVVHIRQPGKGARFTLDSLLLADFCRVGPRDRMLELGAGTGIVSLLLARKSPRTRITAVELEPAAYSLLCRNIEDNCCIDRIVPLNRDIKDLRHIPLTHHAFDVIVANPPYTRSGAGRASPSRERQTARHDQAASLPLWLDCHGLLKNRGGFFLVFPAARLAELMTCLRERNLEPKRIRLVHAYEHKPASLVLIEAVKNAGRGLEVLPPLIVHGTGGAYTAEVRLIYGLP